MASVNSSKDPREMYALKQKACKYYADNGVPVKMEEVLNIMFYDDPQDVYGYLVNFFSQFTHTPTLSKLEAIQVVTADGMPTIQTSAFCTVNNEEKLLTTRAIPSSNIDCRSDDRERAELERSESVEASVKLINSFFSSQLSGIDPCHQEEIDGLVLDEIEKLKMEYTAIRQVEIEKEKEEAALPPPPPPPAPVEEKDKKKSGKDKNADKNADKKEAIATDKKEAIAKPSVEIAEEKSMAKVGKMSGVRPSLPANTEIFVAGSEAVCAISQAVCSCAAVAQDVPLYRHISNIARKKGAVNEIRIPLPMVTIIQSGKHYPGKLNCIKEYMIVPGVNMTIDTSIEHIQNIYTYVEKSFGGKTGGSCYVNKMGALCPSLDTPTQALDLLQEAVNAQDLTIGEDIYLAINIAANDFYDPEKGKYEMVNGTSKSCDDMVEFWADLITKYPAILAIVDPFRSQDSEAWMKLCERVSEVTYIVGNKFYSRPGLLTTTEIPTLVHTSGIVMYQQKINSVTDLINCTNQFQDLKNEIIISTNEADTTDSFIVDLAVGLNARFLKLGGPRRGEKTSKLNRMLQIYSELEQPEAEPQGNHASQEIVHDKLPELIEECEEKDEDEIKTEDESKIEKGQSFSEPRTGENENSILKNHSHFVFPLIQNPPPPQADKEEEEEHGEGEGEGEGEDD